jgi:transcriptional regulator with XRE-family HTH domain
VKITASKLLKKARNLRGMTRDEVCTISGYSVNSLKRWETKKVEPKFNVVLELLNDVYKLQYEEAISLLGEAA